MKRLATSLIPDLRTTLATETPYATIYKEMGKRVLVLEDNARAQQKILRTRLGRTATENPRSKQPQPRESEDQESKARGDNTSSRRYHTRG